MSTYSTDLPGQSVQMVESGEKYRKKRKKKKETEVRIERGRLPTLL